MTVSVLCTLYVLSMVALLNERWLKYLWSILSWNRDCSNSQLRWKWWWRWWLLFCTITSTLAASSGCCRQSKLWAKWEETAALCPETEKGPLQTEDLSPRVRSRCTLREGSSCRAGCLCAPSIGKLSQLSSFTPSSNRRNMAATSHSQLFTIFFSVLKVERDRRNQWKVWIGPFRLLFPAFLSASVLLACRYFDRQPQKPLWQVLGKLSRGRRNRYKIVTLFAFCVYLFWAHWARPQLKLYEPNKIPNILRHGSWCLYIRQNTKVYLWGDWKYLEMLEFKQGIKCT